MGKAFRNRAGTWLLAGITALALLVPPVAAAPAHQEGDPRAQADAHYDAGWAQVNAGDYLTAHQEFEQALSLYQVAQDQKGEAYALTALGWIELNSGQPDAALTRFEVALPLWQTLNVPAMTQNVHAGLAAALTDVATAKAAAGQHDEALSDLVRALDLYRTINDERQLIVLNEIVKVQIASTQYEEAKESSRQMLELCQAAQDQLCQIAALNNLGEIYDKLGKPADALAQHKLAQELCSETSECAASAVDIQANIGRDYVNLGEYDKALAILQQALSAARALPDPKREATLLNSIGSTYTRQAVYGEALTQLQAARSLFQTADFPEGMEATDINIGELYHQTGRLQDALQAFQSARDLAIKISDLEGEAIIWGNVASVYADLGQFEEAIRGHQAALDIWQRLGSLQGQAVAQNALGVIMVHLRQYEAAERYYRAAADLRIQIGSPYGIAVTVSNVGDLYVQLGRFPEAVQQFTVARDQARSINAPAVEANALDNMGAAQAELDEYEAALASHRAALAIRRSIGDRSGEGTSQANIGAVYGDQGQYPDALAQFEVALELFRETGQSVNQAQVLANAGRVSQRQGNLAEAIRFYRDAVDLTESVQGKIKTEELATSFAAGQASLYGRLIDALVESGQPETAFDYAERARARAFLDQLGNQPVDFRAGASAELIEQEQALRQRIIGLQSALDTERAKPFDQQNQSLLDTLSADLEQARKDYQSLLTHLKLASPEYASLVSVSALTLSEVQGQVLDRDTTLIEYFVLDEYTLAWVVDRDSFQTIRLEITRADLKNKVESLREGIKSRSFDSRTAAGLHGAIFAPLAPSIHHPNLVIVPHDALHYLPFVALWDAQKQRYLAQDYALTYAPSASALKFILAKRNPDAGRLLVLGNPDGTLADAESEAKAVASLYGVTPFLREEASESQVRARAGQLDILHLAAHGEYDPYNPLFTRIELAPGGGQDGKLEVHEVYGLDLTGGNLVVLSACNTALGAQSAGDELVGLTRAFLYAGAPAVVTTLWSIEDAASAALMERFYSHLRESLTTAEALRAAQLEVLAQEKWGTPYYWAAFSLTGDYRGNSESRMATESAPGPARAAAPAATATAAPTAAAGPTPGRAGGGLCGSSAILPLGLVMLVGLQRLRTHRRARL